MSFHSFETHNYGQFSVKQYDRSLHFGPSPGGQFFYLRVKVEGNKAWPTEREKAMGAWIAQYEGFTTLVCKTPDGERHISLPERSTNRFLHNFKSRND